MSTVSSTPSNTLHLIARLVGCIALLATFQGCQFAPQMPTAKWPWSKKPAPIPDRLFAVWSDWVLHQPGLPGVRGCGGRVYFYQAPETDPIKVDGALGVDFFDSFQG